jgi:phenylacetate-coenzyme A ligase PaaK-like adenylate-forming protein
VTHLCARRDTFVFPTVFAVWRGAGFVKENLDEGAWPGGRAAARRFAKAWPAPVASGDPIAFEEAMAWELPLATRAFVSTSFRMDAALAARLERTYGARVIDWYSLTETGPIAASVPGEPGHEVLSHDVFVEALSDDGTRVADGAIGELAVTCGRNPLLPLVRYRTGDHGRVVRAARQDGTVAARILDLDGRRPVVYRDADGRPVASVDLTRALRAAAVFAHHEIAQATDGALSIRVREAPGFAVDAAALDEAVRAVLGPSVAATVEVEDGGERT